MGKESKLPSSMSLIRLPAEGVGQIKGVPSYLKRSRLKMVLPTSKIVLEVGLLMKKEREREKKSLPAVPVLVNSRCN